MLLSFREFLLLAMALLLLSCGTSRRNDNPIQPVSLKQVEIHDTFWAPRLETNRIVTIPWVFQKCEDSNLSIFQKTNGRSKIKFLDYKVIIP